MKAIIFTINAGGGHNAAAQAIKENFSPEQQVKVISLIKDVLWPLDPIFYITLGKKSLDDYYNVVIQKKANKAVGFLSYSAVFLYPIAEIFIYFLVRNYIKKHNPTVIISVVPILNRAFGSIAQKLDKIFIVVPTDLDTRWFTQYLAAKSYKNFIFTIPFNDSMIWQNLEGAYSLKHHIKVAGFPIKKSFFESKDIQALKKKYGVPEDKKVIMLLMGGIGSSATLMYTKELLKLASAVHLLICIGKNEGMKNELEVLFRPNHISWTIIGYTDSIADLMALADFLVTKSGSVSVCEALYMNLPMLLDGTNKVLPWERFNHLFINQHGFGETITKQEDIVLLAERYLNDPVMLERTKKRITEYQKPLFANFMKKHF